MSRMWLVVRLAFRHMRASPSTLVIGGIVLLVSMLIVVGGSLVTDVGGAVSQSVVESVAGNLQAYSANSKDELDLFAALENIPPRLEPIPDFDQVKRVFKAVPNVRAVIPMGIALGYISGETPLDIALRRLREMERLRHDARPFDEAEREGLKRQVRQIARVLLSDFSDSSALFKPQQLHDNLEALQRATSDPFWQGFDQEPFASLEFLENRVAPQLADGEPLDFGFLGTDPQAFTGAFSRFHVVEGQPIPPGQHGLLLSKYYYEHKLKLATALRLDEIHDALVHGGRIAEDPALKEAVLDNRLDLREIILQLDDRKNAQLVHSLQGELKSPSTSLSELLTSFFTMDDGNFAERYRFFYDRIAPLLQLYRARIGDPLVVRQYGAHGTINSLKLTIYGTYEFRGLEGSETMGAISLLDLDSFRHLQGFPTQEDVAEEREMMAQVADLVDPSAMPRASGASPVLNVAITLVDPSLATQTQAALARASERANLGLRIVPWQDTAGTMGHVTQVAGIVLGVAVFLILLVALAIANNAVMMTTLRRTGEIGTLRAMGASRRMVMVMVLSEAMVVAVVFASIGSALSAALLLALGKTGIPAPNDAVNFLFGGPRLWPALHGGLALVAVLVTVLATIVFSFSPALLAMRISPVRAMQAED